MPESLAGGRAHTLNISCRFGILFGMFGKRKRIVYDDGYIEELPSFLERHWLYFLAFTPLIAMLIPDRWWYFLP